MAQLPIPGLTTHAQQVKSLYKRAVRMTQSRYFVREIFRYEATLLRDRFDQNSCIKDESVAKQLLAEGEKELFLNQHWSLIKFPNSPGGVAFERDVIPPDWVVDYWHPLEKAQYPDYFEKRECRKKQYIAMWDKLYCVEKPDPPKGPCA